MDLIIWRKMKYFSKHKFPHIVLSFLPRFFVQKIISSRLEINTDLGQYENITFKVADTIEEIEGALSLIQKTYLQTGLTTDSDNLQRVLKYNLLPTTLVVVAKHYEEVIATMSVVTDSVLGLPIDEISDISSLRKTQKVIAEFSGLVIARGWRRENKRIFSPLTLYLSLIHI